MAPSSLVKCNNCSNNFIYNANSLVNKLTTETSILCNGCSIKIIEENKFDTCMVNLMKSKSFSVHDLFFGDCNID